MTVEQLRAVWETLTELVDAWNDAAADEDRGRANNALAVTLYDDGSGRIGRRNWHDGTVDDWHEFNNFEELVVVLRDSEGVEFDPEATEPNGGGG
jgi:hypothetical protein